MVKVCATSKIAQTKLGHDSHAPCSGLSMTGGTGHSRSALATCYLNFFFLVFFCETPATCFPARGRISEIYRTIAQSNKRLCVKWWCGRDTMHVFESGRRWRRRRMQWSWNRRHCSPLHRSFADKSTGTSRNKNRSGKVYKEKEVPPTDGFTWSH